MKKAFSMMALVTTIVLGAGYVGQSAALAAETSAADQTASTVHKHKGHGKEHKHHSRKSQS